MSRKSPLFDPDKMIDDLLVQALTPMARLFYYMLLALANKGGDGYLRIGGRLVGWGEAAALLRFPAEMVAAAAAEITGMRLFDEDRHGVFHVEIRHAAELRKKRARAGAKGGQKTTAGRGDVVQVDFRSGGEGAKKRAAARPSGKAETVCSSKPVSFVGSKAYAERAKKEKRTKKEKNNNYIYIIRNRVYTGDAFTPENPRWVSAGPIDLPKRTFTVIADTFGLSQDGLQDIIENTGRWLEEQGNPELRANWLGVLIGRLRKVTGCEGRELADREAA